MPPIPMAVPSTPALAADLCDALLRQDLPALPDDRRAEVVAFAATRVAGLPSPIRLGVGAVALGISALGALAGADRIARAVGGRPLPVAGEYVRLLRSLAYAYVWETWPATQPDGAPRPSTAVTAQTGATPAALSPDRTPAATEAAP